MTTYNVWNIFKIAPPFVPIPIQKGSMETNTETLLVKEASSQTARRTQWTHVEHNHYTQSSVNQLCHALVNISRKSFVSNHTYCINKVLIQFLYTRTPRVPNFRFLCALLKIITCTSQAVISFPLEVLFIPKCMGRV